MKFAISTLALFAAIAMTGCKDNVVNQSGQTSAPTQVAHFNCTPNTRVDWINNNLVRETRIDGGVTELVITGGTMNMRLTVNDTHINATREFSDFTFDDIDTTRLKYTTEFVHNDKAYIQKFFLQHDAFAKERFYYQRATVTLSDYDDDSTVAVVMSGWCQRVGTV